MTTKAALPTLDIGIAAYNAERNIGRLLESLLAQTTSRYIPGQIIVHSDASSDQTVAIAKRFNIARVRVIERTTRGGFAQSFARLLTTTCQADLVLMLNDDVVLQDRGYLDKLVVAFDSASVGLVCGSVRPLPAEGLVERATSHGCVAFRYLGDHIRQGLSGLTCDGKAMALSRAYADALTLPSEAHLLANVDGYIYLDCIQRGFAYRYARDAVLHFRSPTTIADFVKWQSRNYRSRAIWRETFGELVDREYPSSWPRLVYGHSRELLRDPIAAVLMAGLTLYLRGAVRESDARAFSATWEPVQTTKDL